MKSINVILFLIIFLFGCAKPSMTTGSLGFADSRRIVIVGENVDPGLGVYYQRKYDALVWFTPFEGKIVNKTNNFFQSGLGPSVAMRGLIRELKSINYTVGQWEIFVPKSAENYFLATLKNMENDSMSKARGMIILPDSMDNKQIELQLSRVTDNNFFVNYEYAKENAPERDRTSNP